MDVSYEQFDLNKIVDNVKILSEIEKNKLHKLLSKYELLFYNSFGDFNCDPAELELKLDKNNYHAKITFGVPHINQVTLKK